MTTTNIENGNGVKFTTKEAFIHLSDKMDQIEIRLRAVEAKVSSVRLVAPVLTAVVAAGTSALATRAIVG